MEANISNMNCSFENVYVQYRQNPLFKTVTRFTLRREASVQQSRKKNQQYFNPLLPLLLKKANRKTKSEKIPYICMITKWMHP